MQYKILHKKEYAIIIPYMQSLIKNSKILAVQCVYRTYEDSLKFSDTSIQF